jgi:hypothetical protein
MGLPDLFTLEHCSGRDTAEKWKSYIESLYKIFKTTLVDSGLTFNGLPIKCRWHDPYDGKHASFWHLVSEGEEEANRTPDPRRCERLSWIAWVIRRAADVTLVRSWMDERSTNSGRKSRITLWLYGSDYVVILEPRETYCLLVTAYCTSPRRREKLEKRWAAEP